MKLFAWPVSNAEIPISGVQYRRIILTGEAQCHCKHGKVPAFFSHFEHRFVMYLTG